MPPKRQALAIGGFVLGAAAILAVGIVLFGSGLFFRREAVFVAFFDGSVKGLGVGAPVTFRGVRVGTVSDMRVTVNPEDGRIFIPVHLRLEMDRFVTEAGTPIPDGGGRFVLDLIDRGLKAQAQLQSLVTGQLMVDLDFFPERQAVLRGQGGDHPEMPTIPSKAEELARSFEELPVGDILADLTAAIQSISQIVTSEEVVRIVRSMDAGLANLNAFLERTGPAMAAFNSTLADVGEVMATVQRQTDPLAEDLKGTLGDARRMMRSLNESLPPLTEQLNRAAVSAESAVDEAQRVFAALNGVMGQESPLRFEISRSLQDLSAAARSVKSLADALERHPEALLRGKPPGRFD